jgi:hypothetical protein
MIQVGFGPLVVDRVVSGANAVISLRRVVDDCVCMSSRASGLGLNNNNNNNDKSNDNDDDPTTIANITNNQLTSTFTPRRATPRTVNFGPDA